MQSIHPTLKDNDAHAAIDFLERAFGFERHAVHEPNDTDYGSREYTARDPEGDLWSFGTYRPGAG